jgi:UDP-glucose 4-epimerase
MKKVLITGGAGFIGSHTVEKFLSQGYHVTVLDNFTTGRIQNISAFSDQVEIIECDLGINGDWRENFNNTDIVIHLAALADIVPSIQSPNEYFNSNVTGTFNVLQASRDAKIKKFIYAASSSCYGIPQQYPTPEIAPISPQYPYALTKRLGEEIALHWEQVYDIPVISLRFFNVYGPKSRTSGTYGAVFGVFLAQKLAGKPFTVVGDGSQTRDFTYVSDVADAIYTAAKSNLSGDTFNVGSGKSVSINQITKLLDGPVVYIPKRPGEPDCTFADISKINNELNWFPKVTIEEGVEKLIKNIDYWKDAPVWNKDSIGQATKDWFKYLDK